MEESMIWIGSADRQDMSWIQSHGAVASHAIKAHQESGETQSKYYNLRRGFIKLDKAYIRSDRMPSSYIILYIVDPRIYCGAHNKSCLISGWADSNSMAHLV